MSVDVKSSRASKALGPTVMSRATDPYDKDEVQINKCKYDAKTCPAMSFVSFYDSQKDKKKLPQMGLLLKRNYTGSDVVQVRLELSTWPWMTLNF